METVSTTSQPSQGQIGSYRFDLEAIREIRKYGDPSTKYFQGNAFRPGIRWMILDAEGRNVSCDKCGNFANGVLFKRSERYMLRIPLCRGHLQKWMSSYPDYIWNEQHLICFNLKDK